LAQRRWLPLARFLEALRLSIGCLQLFVVGTLLFGLLT
jgi:hypothetical protein